MQIYLQFFLNCSFSGRLCSKSFINCCCSFLRQLSDNVFKAANIFANRAYYNAIFQERCVGTEINQNTDALLELRKTWNAQKERALKEQLKAEIDILDEVTKVLKRCEDFFQRDLDENDADIVPHLIEKCLPVAPLYVRNVLSDNVLTGLKTAAFDIRSGKRHLVSCSQRPSIPFDKAYFRLFTEGSDVRLSWANNIYFVLNFGKDKQNNRGVVENLIKGVGACNNASIQLAEDKIFLTLLVDMPQEEPEEDALDLSVLLKLNT